MKIETSIERIAMLHCGINHYANGSSVGAKSL